MQIETERLILRPFVETDVEALYSYLHEPAVNCFMSMKVNDLEEAKAAVEERIKDKTGTYLAIELKENQKVIGEICAHAESTDPTNSTVDTFSPCWMLDKAYQGKGYMYEAVSAYYDFLFTQKGARRIYIYTEDYNIACQRLSEKLGMRREGLFMEFVSFVNDTDGQPIYENTYQYALLKKEWESRVISN